MQNWSVGVMCYNEAGCIEPVVVQLREVMQQITDTFEIVIVDDCSTDGSSEIALKLQIPGGKYGNSHSKQRDRRRVAVYL